MLFGVNFTLRSVLFAISYSAIVATGHLDHDMFPDVSVLLLEIWIHSFRMSASNEESRKYRCWEPTQYSFGKFH